MKKMVYTNTSSYLCEDTKVIEVGDKVFDIANKKWLVVSAPNILEDVVLKSNIEKEGSTDSNITFPGDGEEDSNIPEELSPADEVVIEE